MNDVNEAKQGNNFFQKHSKIIFLFVSILIGLIVGGIALLLAGYNPLLAYKVMLEGVFSKPRNIGWTIVLSTPIILTGLGVAFAFQTGMFNIGAEGQYIVGTIAALIVGTSINLPKPIQVPLILITAMAAGALWGGLAGFIKAKFGIHEVISTIMLNWIAFYFNNFIANSKTFKKANAMSSIDINSNSEIGLFPEASKHFEGRLQSFFSSPVHFGIIIAIIVAIILYFILNKTAFGYKLKAVGKNPMAAEYGGINVNRTMATSMAISGAVCAIAGAVQLMGYTHHIASLGAMENFGFDGLGVALLAANNPIGCIFTGLFFGALNYSGANIQRVLHAPTEMIQIIIGTIILFSAMPMMFKILKAKLNKGGKKK